MENITYLFGAGASKNSIPIVGELKNSMIEIKNKLLSDFDLNQENLMVDEEEYLIKDVFEDVIKDLGWVIQGCEVHQSVDTFAKKLYIQGGKELKKLKSILSIYFLVVQALNKVDNRYDSFFASILGISHLDFPGNLKILTWNYDHQFEKAYAEYSQDYSISACQTQLNIYSKNSRHAKFETNRFGIIKLNGTASIIVNTDESTRYNVIENVNAKYDLNLFRTLLQNYLLIHRTNTTKHKLMSSISFAWEEYDYGKPVVEKAIEATSETEILVVIGYSFPFFNLLVDRDIIRAMSKLKKVYFQAPDAENLKERFLAIRDDLSDRNLKTRNDVSQFVFPYEF